METEELKEILIELVDLVASLEEEIRSLEILTSHRVSHLVTEKLGISQKPNVLHVQVQSLRARVNKLGSKTMQMTEVDVNGLVVRVKRLERQNRIWKAVGLMVLLVVGISATASVTAQQRVQAVPMRATTIEAQNFLLRDAAGTPMGRLAVKDGKPILELYDAAGRVTWSTNTRLSGLMATK